MKLVSPLHLALTQRGDSQKVMTSQALYQLFQEMYACEGSVTCEWKAAEAPLLFVFRFTTRRPIHYAGSEIPANSLAEIHAPGHVVMGPEPE